MTRPPESFEECMSLLSASAGALDRIPALTKEEINRLRQQIIRLSNVERRFTRESEK